MKRRTIIILAIVALALIIGGIVYYKFRRSPAYSLLQLKNSIENHDYAGFEKYVDVDGTMNSLIDQVYESMQADEGAKSKPGMWSMFGSGFMDFAKPQLTLFLKPQIQRWVEHGKWEGENPLDKNVMMPVPESWRQASSFQITGIEMERSDGKTSLIGIGIRHPHFDTTFTVDIVMKHKGDHWQIEGVAGLAKFQKELDRLEQKRIDGLNAAVKDEIGKSLTLSGVEKSNTIEGGVKTARLTLRVKNNTSKIITGFSSIVALTDRHGTQHKEFQFDQLDASAPLQLGPGKETAVDWPTDGTFVHDPWLHDTATSDLVLVMMVDLVQFSDGTTIRMRKKWED